MAQLTGVGMARSKYHDSEAEQLDLHDYTVIHPVERRGRLYKRRDVLRLIPEEAAGWLKSGYIQLTTGDRPPATDN
jgi:hypothetical protein